MIATIGDVLFVSACCRNGLTPRFDAREAWIAVVFFFFFRGAMYPVLYWDGWHYAPPSRYVNLGVEVSV